MSIFKDFSVIDYIRKITLKTHLDYSDVSRAIEKYDEQLSNIEST
jgi:hypothetical protein